MPLRRFWIVLGILLLPDIANADGHRAGFYGAASFARASTLAGVHVAGSWLPKSDNWALLGDFSVHSGTHDGVDLTVKTFMFGVSRALKSTDRSVKHVGGLHAHFGGVNGGGTTDPVIAFGGSYDFVPQRNRGGKGWAIRAQFDHIVRLGDDTDSFQRVSVGAVFRLQRIPK